MSNAKLSLDNMFAITFKLITTVSLYLDFVLKSGI